MTTTTPTLAPLAVSAREAAKLLGISERSLWGVTTPRGDCPCVRVGSRVIYRIADLNDWLANKSQRKEMAQ